jgi:hypothetical protein
MEVSCGMISARKSEYTADRGSPTEAVRSTSEDPAITIQGHIDRGLNLYKCGLIHDAFVEFLEVLAADSNDPLGHYLCGVTLQAMNLEDMALSEWAAASSLNVRDGELWDSDWDWIRTKSNEFLRQGRESQRRVTA